MRITIAHLDSLIQRINELTDSPLEYSTDNKRGGFYSKRETYDKLQAFIRGIESCS